ncbi:COP1-interactive protein 1-like isoform X2 [Argentina anserina]|uniref:COP1-interactive protein 1-like isoform X2 n=1 Tax=Argentina anserina TaxID=57926 RepID=UPI00217695A9|nr:COP1-interactive protein 1-like isoform X2 [Potentilla anserina]XP_050370230.1 COP1-interactive protein 1-like isoform X2 [Potentilla anserina]
MARIRQVARRTTGDMSPPNKRPRTTLDCRDVPGEEYDRALKERDSALNELSNLKAELKVVQSQGTSDRVEFALAKTALEAEKKAVSERLDREVNNFALELKNVLKELCKREVELEKASQERDSYRESLESEKKEWEDEKMALTQRLDKTSQELDTYKKSLDLGNTVWEAERIEMARRIEMANKENQRGTGSCSKFWRDLTERKEMAKSRAMSDKEKEKAYCKGYIDGWFKKPQASYKNSFALGNNVSEAELEKHSQDKLISENNVWEAERIKMTKRISMAKVAEVEKIQIGERTARGSQGMKKDNWSKWGDQEASYASYKNSFALGNNVSEAELEKDSQDNLKSGNNVWEAERIKMTKRIAMEKVAEVEEIQIGERTAIGAQERKKDNWPKWGAQEASYASYDFQIGQRSYGSS